MLGFESGCAIVFAVVPFLSMQIRKTFSCAFVALRLCVNSVWMRPDCGNQPASFSAAACLVLLLVAGCSSVPGDKMHPLTDYVLDFNSSVDPKLQTRLEEIDSAL